MTTQTGSQDDPLEHYDELVMAGEPPNAEEFAARYPEHPDLLQRIEKLNALRGDLDQAVRHLCDEHRERPQEIGDYQILELIGEGGMGDVFVAEHAVTKQICALKILRQSSAKAMLRFQREAQLAAQLDHPHVARVFDSGVAGGFAYLACELVIGFPLRDMLRAAQGKPPREVRSIAGRTKRLYVLDGRAVPPASRDPWEVAALTLQVAKALAYAHGRGVIHRDVKPSNIMVTPDGDVKLIDFGIAVPRDPAERITDMGVFVGSHQYAAPEQLRGERLSVGPWTDTYALGASLYEMLTFKTPFHQLSLTPRALRAGDRPNHAPRELNAGVPLALNALVMHALEPVIEARFRDGAAMASELAALLEKHRGSE